MMQFRYHSTAIFAVFKLIICRWYSGSWEKHYDWPASVRIMDWLSTQIKNSPGDMDL